MKQPLQKTLKELFSLDIRSLALFRVALGVNLLFDLAVRSLTLRAFYSDTGVLPRPQLLVQNQDPWFWSLHLLGGNVFWQACLFILAGVFALFLMIGYRTRLMTFLSWLMLISLHHRMPYTQNSGDVYLRLSLFWCLFIPLGAYGSLDRELQSPIKKVPQHIFSAGSIALMLQTCIMYWTTAAYKYQGADWAETGRAVYYVLNMEVFATPAAHALLMFPQILTGLTFAVLIFEAFGPFLLLCPVRTGLVRTWTLAGFALMHACFGLCLRVDPFPRLAILGLLPFLPTWFWDRTQSIRARLQTLRPFATLEKHLREGTQRLAATLAKRPLPIRPPAWEHALASFLLALTIYWVVDNFQVGPLSPHSMPRALSTFCQVVHLDQAWNIFAPAVSRKSGWFVIPGKLQNGQTVDLYKDGAPLSWARPPSVSKHFKTERWRKYFTGLMGGRREGFQEYTRYLCQSWNATHTGGEQLQSLTFVLVANTTLENYQMEIPHAETLWRAMCVPPPNPAPSLRTRPAGPRGRPPQLIMQVPNSP